MFSKKIDVLNSKKTSKQKVAELLNQNVELCVKANSFANQAFPQAGELIFGETGTEFRTASGIGFIQIPWSSIQEVKVDLLGKTHVRAITIETGETAPLEFVISDGKAALQVLAAHIGRDKITRGPQNIKAIGKQIKNFPKAIANKIKRE